MEKTTSFDLSICRLLQEYPLYDYRTLAENGFALSVLLIGSGSHLNTLRSKVLSNGQLLDTELTVTIVTENAGAAVAALRESAPDLERFIELQNIETPAEWKCGALCYEEYPSIADNFQTILDQHPACKYVLISLETEDDAPKTISPAPGQLVAWVAGDTIQVCGKKQVFRPNRDDRSMGELLDIAYRLHYAYEKGNDPHITNREIRASFNISYNYLANIECALHVRSKIKSAGIDPSALNSAAEEFSKRIAEDAQKHGDLLERLALLEHRRWCISKVANGYRKLETVNMIFGEDGSTTHSTDNSNKWHVALVPYGKDGKLYRHLSEQDWTVDDPKTITDLDELDKQTLLVHRRCAEISKKKLQCSMAHIAKLRNEIPGDLTVHVDQMEAALEQMREGNREAVFVYRYHRRNLETRLAAAGSDAGLNTLKILKQDMGATIEYLTRKDYKKQNLVLVGSIPFALCGWKSTVLVKLMAESVHECVAAAWQLEPGRIIFVDTAETLDELKQLRRKAQQIDRFLSRNCNLVKSSYHVFVPQNTDCIPDVSTGGKAAPFLLQDILTHDPTFFGSGEWHLYPRRSLEPDELRPRFVELMYECGATSIDMTGGKPMLISLADSYARNNRAGAFFIRDNRIRNFCGAQSMEQQALDKGLTVQQLFDQTDAELIKRDDEQISGVFFKKYEALWRIAHAHAAHWYRFCLCFAKAYRDKSGSPDPDEQLRVPVIDLRNLLAGEFRVYKPEFDIIIQKLLTDGLLKYVQHKRFYQAACEEVIACLRNSGKVLEYYIYCAARTSGAFEDVAMSWMFRHNDRVGAAKNEVDVICTGKNNTLFISCKNVTPASLDKNNFLNYICYEVGWLADRFGGTSPRTILAAPNVAQFENGKRSDLVEKAMKRGVYLLGSQCFEPGNLIRVLRNIDRSQDNWCEFLLGEAEPACV